MEKSVLFPLQIECTFFSEKSECVGNSQGGSATLGKKSGTSRARPAISCFPGDC